MTPLVPLMMFGWIAFSISIFSSRNASTAAMIVIIGGTLFLPMARYDIPGLPTYTKNLAIGLSVFFGVLLVDTSTTPVFRFDRYDIPILLWSFVGPLATSSLNGLGFVNAIGTSIDHFFGWSMAYLAGRWFFRRPEDLRRLVRGLVIGGAIYIPPALFEVRMSPQLSNIVYGFFPHSFEQHFRYGGFRPIVFMQHGLMVSLWMAATFTMAFWMWRTKRITRILGIPMWILVPMFFVTVVLCKSANGWFFSLLGIAAYLYFKTSTSARLLRLILFVVPVYIVVRTWGVLPAELLHTIAARVFDDDRAASLMVRLVQENLFGDHALQRPLFGWGGWGRGWPVDPYTGQRAVNAVDSLYIILLSSTGFFGLASLFTAYMFGPWKILSRIKESIGEYNIDAQVLSLVVMFFAVDALLNSMINPVYLLIAGALTSYYCYSRDLAGITVRDLRPFPELPVYSN